MPQYQPAPPATQIETGVRTYIMSELRRVASALDVLEGRMLKLAKFDRLADLPEKVEGGELMRVGEGLYRWSAADSRWEYLLSAVEALAVFSFAAYGAARVTTPYAITIGAGWSPIVYDVESITPRLLTLVPAAGTVAADHEGVYRFSVSGSINHNSSNQGRTTYVRLFNVATGTPSGSFAIGIGRNVEDTAFAVEVPFEVTAAGTGQAIRLEIGGGSTLTGATMSAAALLCFAIGEWREGV